jgi:hypothetical protein
MLNVDMSATYFESIGISTWRNEFIRLRAIMLGYGRILSCSGDITFVMYELFAVGYIA